jgi:hypothetical protein
VMAMGSGGKYEAQAGFANQRRAPKQRYRPRRMLWMAAGAVETMQAAEMRKCDGDGRRRGRWSCCQQKAYFQS